MTTRRYALDELNRLVAADAGDGLVPPRVLDGRLSLRPKNRLVYHVRTPSGAAVPDTIHLDGTWSLTPSHELALTLHAAESAPRQTIYLKGAVVNTEAHALVFALRRHQDDDLRTAQRLSLSGRWQADARNRLTFLAEQAGGTADRLTLQGGWEVGPRHELRYRYRQQIGPRRRQDEHLLSFDGAWDITARNRLVYRMEGASDSAFEFRASLQSPSLLASRRRVVYQVGVGLAGGRTRRRQVALFGKWKLYRDLSVAFEVPYADGRMEAIRFEGEMALSARDRVGVALRTSRKERLGLTVLFSSRMTRDRQLFLRVRQEADETSAIGGIQVRF